jgi:hypothetical protein
MARKVSLAVNNVPINIDYFVRHYLDCIAGGIIASLHDTGEIAELEISLDNTGDVKITLNNSDVSLKPFPVEIIRSTLLGMVAPLKGVDSVVNSLELTIVK